MVFRPSVAKQLALTISGWFGLKHVWPSRGLRLGMPSVLKRALTKIDKSLTIVKHINCNVSY